MIGYNWRHKHLVFRDDEDGNGYITFKPNWHKRTARPQDWEDLFTRYGPGVGNITSDKLNPMKAKSIYDSALGKTIIDDLNEGIIKRYLAEKSSYGVKKGIIASLKIIWYFAKDNGYLGDKPKVGNIHRDPTLTINLKKPSESKSLDLFIMMDNIILRRLIVLYLLVRAFQKNTHSRLNQFYS